MSSIGGILSIARSALYANQAAIQVTSHNISNAQTEGYSRQRPVLVEGSPLRIRNSWLGTGVEVADIARVRDGYLDLSVRREYANASGFGLRRDILLQLEGVFGEPSEEGLSATLDAFWSAWSDLANAPDSAAARGLVRQRGDQVASTLNAYDRRLTDLESSTLVKMQAQVGELNSLLTRVAELNGRILSAEADGRTASDLRDARDVAIDQASRLADLRVIQRSNGSVALVMGSRNLVDGDDARPVELAVERDGGGRLVSVALTTRGDRLDGAGSALQGAIDGLDDIRSAREQLDSLARYLVSQVNGIHNTAPLNRDFFADLPGGATAATIRLSDEIRSSAANVLAGTAGTDNSIALQLAALRDASFVLTDGAGDPLIDANGDPLRASIGGFYRDLVASVAFKTSDAERATQAAEVLAQQALTRRESVSGVSIDEELILLMRHQQAYAAATKLVNAADEMLESLLAMV